MNSRVLRRFIINLAILTAVVSGGWLFWQTFLNEDPGDYYTRQGDIYLGSGEYADALRSFDRALKERPNHRGALMGRALVYSRTRRPGEAVAELTRLIAHLQRTLRPDDATGRGALAAAHANRGIVLDREGKHEEALADYLESLRIDAGAVSGPGLVDKILYGNSRPSTVRDRAIYLHKQLALPEGQRLLRVPELDEKQRMHKP